jgi:DNA polymerase (family 10)
VSALSTLAGSLRTLADLADVRGAGDEGAELRRAADAIDKVSSAAATRTLQRARQNGLTNEPDIAPGLTTLVRILALEGPDATIRSVLDALPSLYARLLARGLVAPDEAANLVGRLGILTLPDLQAALADGHVYHFGGENLQMRLLRAAADLEDDLRPAPLGRARDVLEAFAAEMFTASASLDLIVPAGDVRRFETLVRALTIVARAPDPPLAIDAICGLPAVEEVRYRSGRRAVLGVHHAEIDVRVAPPDEYGTLLFHATGAPGHVRAVVQRTAAARIAAREEDVYVHARLPYIEPELRQNEGEIEAAEAGRLPALISREHIRGDLHMHTTYSDGGDTLDAMVAACCRLGYEYLAITDHSQRAAASRTLSRSDLSRQRDEIEAIRARYPSIVILHGVETDIMPNGSLDFADRVLESLDIVLASLHDSAGHDAKRLTRRCIQAIRHPLVTVITHPANRLVGRREGYRLDFDAVYAAAAETGTALEIDGAPSHLDLDGEHARAAIGAGVTLTVDSDCHRARWLGRQMELGIGTARRGWVEPRHVLNTRPLADVLAFIAARRRRG